MKRRKLREDELSLWRSVARSATPLSKDARNLEGKPVAEFPTTTTKTPAKSAPIQPFRIGAKDKNARGTRDLQAPLAERLNDAPVNMDFKTYKRMKRGKLKPEARIDLHGMTIAAAHPALNGFILRAQAQGKRLVLVITGKGRRGADDDPIPQRVGVLRHEVPRWLSMPPLAAFVQQVTPASDRHGGHGAYYVYLRRS